MAKERTCESCGKPYKVKGPKQRYCHECGIIAGTIHDGKNKHVEKEKKIDTTNDDAIIAFIRSEMKKLHEKHESWIKMLHELGARIVELEKLVIPLNKMYNEEKLKRAKEAEEKRIENLKRAFEMRNDQ